LTFSFIFCSVLYIFWISFNSLIVNFLFNMASQYLHRDSTMCIPKDILPQFEFLKIALGKESKLHLAKNPKVMY
jgi:hypothetical protein